MADGGVERVTVGVCPSPSQRRPGGMHRQHPAARCVIRSPSSPPQLPAVRLEVV